jgi:predicted ATP-grasp superfamily ATP-dependent carboligase
MTLTKLKLKNADIAYTTLAPEEVRQYLAKGCGRGDIDGFTGTDMKEKVYIGVHAIVLIYKTTVAST